MRKMKVSDVIKHLSELDGEEEIIVAWWCLSDGFPEVPEKDFEFVVESIENKFDWSNCHEELGWFIEDKLADR